MLVLAVLLATASPAFDAIKEAGHALRQGRPVQAREMVGAAMSAGAAGPTVDRLLADLAFVEQRWPEATLRYQALIAAGERSSLIFEQAALAALKQGDDGTALALLAESAGLPDASWRTFNARGILADRRADWKAADAAYRQGLKLDPSAPQILNNYGWSLLLRGEWPEAYRQISKAAAIAPDDARIAANLDLAASALAADLPRRRAGESSSSYADRLNDSGVLALRAGQTAKARAAFANALEVSEHWFARAENNLSLAVPPAASAKR